MHSPQWFPQMTPLYLKWIAKIAKTN